MTTPTVGSGQALPARVVEKIERYGSQCYQRGACTTQQTLEAEDSARLGLVATIADAIEAARREAVEQYKDGESRAHEERLP